MSSKQKNGKQKKKWSRKLLKVICFLLSVIFTPGFFLIQILTVDLCLFEMALWTYMFVNLYGNLILSIMTDTRVGSYVGEGDYCAICKRQRPNGSWHCPICEACILRRDHHCTFLSHCVGLKNFRYFICFLGHCSLFISYTTIFYCYKLSHYSFTDFYNMMDAVVPSFGYDNGLILKNRTKADFTLYLYVVFLIYDIAILAATGTFFFKHVQNVFNGVTAYEAAINKYPPKRDWKINLAQALGTRWYWALLWCMADSPLPAEINTCDN